MNGKFAQSTETNMYYDLLDDDAKRKQQPDLVDDKSDVDISMTHNDNIDSPDSINVDSDLEMEQSDRPRLIEADMEDFNTKKELHDIKRKIENEHSHRNDDYDYKDEKIGSDSDDSKKSSRSEKNNSRSDDKKEKINLRDIKSMDEIPYHMLDDKTKKRRRMEKYGQLLIIKNSGIKLTQDYDYNSDYEEMCFEVNFWNKYQKKRNGVQIGKSFMLNGIQAIEFLNEKYDPFGARLKGWHDNMQISSDSFDGVFGELYEKYNLGEGKMQPEIKLLLMVITSAVSFHAAAKMAEKMPAIDSILKKDPQFLAKLQQKINGGIASSGEQKKTDKDEKERQLYETMKKLKEQRKKYNELEKKQQDLLNSNEKIASQVKRMEELQQKTNIQTTKPSNVSSIIDRIKAKNIMRRADNVINENNDLDDVDSSSSESSVKSNNDTASKSFTLGSDGKPRRRRRRENKSTISITT